MILQIRDEKGNWVEIPVIKGSDYVLTEADKQEIIQEVLAQGLPSSEGVKY